MTRALQPARMRTMSSFDGLSDDRTQQDGSGQIDPMEGQIMPLFVGNPPGESSAADTVGHLAGDVAGAATGGPAGVAGAPGEGPRPPGAALGGDAGAGFRA